MTKHRVPEPRPQTDELESDGLTSSEKDFNRWMEELELPPAPKPKAKPPAKRPPPKR